jgi:Chitobiase/beta-hexosaminidase C-terminal domain/Bacterial Ig-like domain (group 3)
MYAPNHVLSAARSWLSDLCRSVKPHQLPNLARRAAIFGCAALVLSLCATAQTKPDPIFGGDIITTFAGSGTPGYTGDGSKATVAEINQPLGIASYKGNLYFADRSNGVIREVTSGGTISTVAGNFPLRNTQPYRGDGGLATAASLKDPSDIAFDTLGNMYIADQGDNVIRVVNPAGVISTYAGTGKVGYNGDGGSATMAALNGPYALAIDSANNLYISDTGNNAIREVILKTGVINTIAGTGVAGAGGDGGLAVNAELNQPEGLAFDSSNSLYFADNGNSKVREISTSGIISTFAGTGTPGNGSGKTACSAGQATAANLSLVQDIAFDARGNAYISNYFNYGAPYGFSFVCKVDTTGAISIVAGIGSEGYGGDEGRADKATLNEPTFLALDTSGNLYFSDTNNDRIRKIAFDSGPTPTTTDIVCTPNPQSEGNEVTCTATVTPVLDKGVPTGTVTFTTDKATTGPAITLNSAGEAVYATSSLAIGAHTIDATYSSDLNYDTSIGSTPETIITAPTAIPMFTPGAGVYSPSVSVTITDATSGAIIYYTVDGSTPTASSTKYTAPILVSSTKTIEAIAVSGGVKSAVASATYTIPGPNGALQFVPVTPCRIVDTRNPTGAFGGPELAENATRTFDVPQSTCKIPASAVAYSLNVTVVPVATLGYLTIWPAGQPQPVVSTLNSTDGRVKANATITPAGTSGGVSVFASDATQFILDIDGYFVLAGTNPAGLQFFPVAPCRVLDTRSADGPLGGPSLASASGRSFPVQSSSCNIPPLAKAYSLNVTAVPLGSLGFLTIWPTGEPQPVVSTLNAPTGAVTANAAIVPAGTSGDVSVYVSDASEVILDINGYFAPPAAGGLSLYTVTPCRAIDTRNSTPFEGTLAVPIHGSACALPVAAQAYVLNATVLPEASLNYLTLWAQGVAQPEVSTLNAIDGAITSNMAIVPTTNGTIDAYATDTTNLLLDISSYFAP